MVDRITLEEAGLSLVKYRGPARIDGGPRTRVEMRYEERTMWDFSYGEALWLHGALGELLGKNPGNDSPGD